MAVNTFREKDIHFITCDIDLQQKKSEQNAYISLAAELGKSKADAVKAYETAVSASAQSQQKKVEAQQHLLDKDGIKILIVGHSYNLYDEYIGKPIIKNLHELNAVPLLADAVDLKQARQIIHLSAEMSPG